MEAGRYKLELRDDPSGPDDVVPWFWRLADTDDRELAHGWEPTRDKAVEKAKRWILFARAQRSMAPPETETIALDERGDPVPESLAVPS